MRTLRCAGTGVLALAMAAGLAACGDDSDSADTTTTAAEATGASAEFCDAVVEFNSVIFTVDISEETPEEDIKSQGEEIAPVFQAVVDEAPEDLAADAEALNETIQALTEGDAEAFNSDATFEQYTGLVSDTIEVCEFETIDVTGVDFAYEGVPDTIEAGTVAFNFENAAETEDHMMGIIKKVDGVTESFDELLAMPEEESEDKVEFKGEAFAPAGESSSTLATLDPGEYMMICFIGVGSPATQEGPPHFLEGMKQEFTVE